MIISIVLAAFNVDNYILDCLLSLYIQDNKNFEVIIINDGSTDKTETVIHDFLTQYGLETLKNWKLISQNNKGLSNARNTGIHHAKGEYIMFLDGDDAILPNAIDNLHRWIKKYIELDVITFAGKDFNDLNLSKVTENFKVFPEIFFSHSYSRKLFDGQLISAKDYLLETYKKSEFHPNSCFHCIRKNTLVENNLLFHEGVYFEDNLFTRQLYLCAQKILIKDVSIILHRQRYGSIMNSVWSTAKTKSMLIIIHEIKKLRIFNPQMIQHADDLMYNLINRLRKTNSPINLYCFLFNKNFWSNQRSRLLLKLTLLERVKQRIKIVIH